MAHLKGAELYASAPPKDGVFTAPIDFPPHERCVEIEVDPTASIRDILAPYGLPEKLVHLVLVNGHYIAPEARGTRTLQEGDALAVWPPIAGG